MSCEYANAKQKSALPCPKSVNTPAPALSTGQKKSQQSFGDKLASGDPVSRSECYGDKMLGK
ncbi:hypothetical protein [Methylomonas albis]|jgi:hypothetical protein|nr:hypothetical protein [Methylomonas albis]